MLRYGANLAVLWYSLFHVQCDVTNLQLIFYRKQSYGVQSEQATNPPPPVIPFYKYDVSAYQYKIPAYQYVIMSY